MKSAAFASPIQSKQIKTGTARAIRFLPWLLIALTPAAFAAATWNDLGELNLIAAATRLFGFPVVVIELCVIGLAIRRSFRPIATFRTLTGVVQCLLAALILIAFGSAIFASPSPGGALIWTYISLVHLVFGFAVASLATTADIAERRVIWPALIAGICAYALMLAVFVNVSHPATFDWQYLGFGVSNVRQIGFYSAVGTAAALGCALHARGWKSLSFAAAGSFTVAMSFWSGSRGALLALCIGFLATAILMPALRTIRAIVTFGVIGLAGAGLSIFFPLPLPIYGMDRMIGTLRQRSFNDLSSSRLDVWRDAWDAFVKRPVFGYGEGQFGFIAPQPLAAYVHPHDSVLQLLIQWGLVGTTICIVLAVFLIGRCLSSVRMEGMEIAPATLVVLTLATFSLYDGALFHTYPVMMFSFSLAVIVSMRTFTRGANGSRA